MKKNMPINEKSMKQSKESSIVNRSFLKASKSQSFLIRRPKKQSSIEKQKNQISRIDQKVTIYCDKQGFIIEVTFSFQNQHSFLSYGLKCSCLINQSNIKRNNKTGKAQNFPIRLNQLKKKSKLQITIDKQHLAIIKAGVEHIFPLAQDKKHDFLKVLLVQNWQLQQFSVANKRTRVVDGQQLLKMQNNCDEISPLKNIIQADQFRKSKLLNSDSKLKIAWGNAQKDSLVSRKEEILSFTSVKKPDDQIKSNLFDDEIKRNLFEEAKEVQGVVLLRKSLNECDQTRDSQTEHLGEDITSLENKEIKSNRIKALMINLDLWSNETPIKAPHTTSQLQRKKDDSLHNVKMGKKSNLSVIQRFFKK